MKWTEFCQTARAPSFSTSRGVPISTDNTRLRQVLHIQTSCEHTKQMQIKTKLETKQKKWKLCIISLQMQKWVFFQKKFIPSLSMASTRLSESTWARTKCTSKCILHMFFYAFINVFIYMHGYTKEVHVDSWAALPLFCFSIVLVLQ